MPTSDDRPGVANRMQPERAARDAFNHIWMDHEEKCWHCEEPTRWVELAFETALHPGPCTDAKYRELADADAEAERQVAESWAQLPRGTRKEEFGQVHEWTGSVWRHVSKSELDAERWRRL
jgi:hypothetical protein